MRTRSRREVLLGALWGFWWGFWLTDFVNHHVLGEARHVWVSVVAIVLIVWLAVLAARPKQ